MCIFPVPRIDPFFGATSEIMQSGRFPASATLKHLFIRFNAVLWALQPSSGIRKKLERQLRDLKIPLPGPPIADVSITHPYQANSTRTLFTDGQVQTIRPSWTNDEGHCAIELECLIMDCSSHCGDSSLIPLIVHFSV